jgi:citrate lyase synthetase
MTLSYITDIRVEVVEIERKMINETYISASLARKCIENGDYQTISELVSRSTFQYIEKRCRNL